MAYVILGAGAVGGTVGFRLAQSGQRVTFIARGEHGRAMGERGLTLMSPVGSDRLDVHVLESVGEHTFGLDDRLLLCTKSQDAVSALEGLDPRVPVFCFQNGVATEPSAVRILERVYGVMTWIPSSHLEPGVVQVFSDSPAGSFRLGCYPRGEDSLSQEVARDLTDAGFDAVSVPDASRWKYGKLLL
ncbi:MAG: 2-dehydropantoate 2-reductase N-terminal domain-containing protein, partial [Planctomycetota bacterium]|nr:2-dehydropantoate 2-reductase N-terminal domain-containing protein [Planctomycetota bacterium]